jgi:PAS domain S-box-containing protein
MMKQQHRLHNLFYTVLAISFLLSAVSLFFIWFIYALQIGIPFTLKSIWFIHIQYSSIFLLDLFPILVLVSGTLFSKQIHAFLLKNEQVFEKEQSRLKSMLDFTRRLVAGDTNAQFISVDENDQLGSSLVELRDNLKKNVEENIRRKKEDDQRNWISEGMARFSEILRKDNNDLSTLTFNLTSNLVKYLNANQGGFFLLEDKKNSTDAYFQQTACYAYDRRKFAEKKVGWGEGLIGTCALERQSIYLTNVPDGYVSITSGLGESTPRCLLLVPLVYNEELHGVIELASFHVFEKYQIEFVERVAESIASTLSSVKTNIRTAELLHESQEQAEILAAQEEQMRQNMEELQATQEEAARQSEKFISFTNSVNHTLIRAEYQPDGTLIYANTKFLQKLGYTSNAEVEGKHISMFINKKDREWFDPIWEGLSKGGKHFEGDMKHVTKLGQDLWTMATYTCIRREDESVEKILFLAIDTTEQKKLSLDFESQIDALNRSSMKVEFSPDGNIIDANMLFISIMKYTLAELKEMRATDFIARDDYESYRTAWKNVITGVPHFGQFRHITKSKDVLWFRGTYTAVHDMYGDVTKVVFIANDVTKEKLMEIESQKQTEQLRLQEEKLRSAGEELQRKLEEARAEMRKQFEEVEKIKLRNERTLEGALDAILTINQGGTIEFFNKAAEELWGIDRKDAIGNNVKILFSPETIESDEFVASFVTSGAEKQIGVRKEANITNSSGDELPVLFLLSQATVDDQQTFTAFIQNIEVELF